MDKEQSIDTYDIETDIFLRQYQSYVKKNYGKRCNEVDKDCPCCKAYMLYDDAFSYFVIETPSSNL